MLVPPPRVSSQRTGTVFNLEVSPSFIQQVNTLYKDLNRNAFRHRIEVSDNPGLEKISSFVADALGVQGHYINTKLNDTKIFHAPNKPTTVLVLTNEDGLSFPYPDVNDYLRDASERGQDVSIKDGDSLIKYIQDLYRHLGITGDIPEWITQQITTCFS
jgi:hypothetical protein